MATRLVSSRPRHPPSGWSSDPIRENCSNKPFGRASDHLASVLVFEGDRGTIHLSPGRPALWFRRTHQNRSRWESSSPRPILAREPSDRPRPANELCLLPACKLGRGARRSCHRPVDACAIGTGSAASRDLHPAAHHPVAEVPDLVSPDVSAVACSAGLCGRDEDHARADASSPFAILT